MATGVAYLRDRAAEILRANTIVQGDGAARRTYTIPTHGLYPHQWNWDSAICAIGFVALDIERAWCELEALLGAQDDDGMVAHIAFNPEAVSYEPGPQWWGSRRGGDGRHISCITQPPVVGMALRRVLDASGDTRRARPLLRAVQRYHDWLLDVRAPYGGEPVVVHPWESGRDNAVEWDELLERTPASATDFRRVDTGFVDAEQRPTKKHYAHYIGLVEQFSGLGWNQRAMATTSAFRVHDPALSAILARACADIGDVAEACAEAEIAERARSQAEQVAAALNARRDGDGRAWTVDVAGGGEVRRTGCALALQLLQPGLPVRALDTLTSDVIDGVLASPWGVRSTAVGEPGFEARNYWRGPVWAHVTWLTLEGLRLSGRSAAAEILRTRLLASVATHGFAEYHDPVSGVALGGGAFSWTSAVTLSAIAGAVAPTVDASQPDDLTSASDAGAGARGTSADE